MIETPSWGYGDSGTRFGDLPAARPPARRLRDASTTPPRSTASPARAGAVALHFPWDAVDDYAALRAPRRGARPARRRGQPEPLPGPRLQARLDHPSRRRGPRARRVAHLLECVEIATALGSTAQSLWLADGTNYPGQDDLRARRAPAARRRSREVYAALPAEQELLVEYKLFEPAFYATDLADWGSALLICQKLGERAQVLVDLGHHAQGTNIEQIVALLADEGRLGGFHFNNRKYADDDLIVGSVNPFELFLIFFELAAPAARCRG